MKWLIVVYLFAFSFSLTGNETMVTENINQPPKYLYKIISLENWQETRIKKAIQLSADDDTFIHLATEDQLERIIGKYWADAPAVAVLKIETTKLEGDLRLEANPGGSTKYYHLYNGTIPLDGVREVKINYKKP